MLDIRSVGHINVVVPHIEEAEKYYSELFAAKSIACFSNFKNEGMAKNFGLEGLDISLRIVKFTHCNLVLSLIQFHAPEGQKEVPKPNLNDLGGPRHLGLNVENIEVAYDFLKSKSDVEILNKPDFRPVTYSNVSVDQFKLCDEKSEANASEKQRLADLLSKKKCFFFRDKYGVIWELEERYYEES